LFSPSSFFALPIPDYLPRRDEEIQNRTTAYEIFCYCFNLFWLLLSLSRLRRQIIIEENQTKKAGAMTFRLSPWVFTQILICAIPGLCGASTLYYGGNPQFPGGYADQNNLASTFPFTYHVYDDFQVTGAKWDINSFFENLGGDVPSDASIISATYEIRTGISSNNLGTLVASGTLPGTFAFQSASFDGFNSFGLQVDLPSPLELTAGTYWLSLTPNTNYPSGQLYLRDTLLGGGIGSPGADNLAYFYVPGTVPPNPSAIAFDASIGILGTAVVPEPAMATNLGMLAACAMLLPRIRRSKRPGLLTARLI
jgi:hypothetical protein